MKAIFGGSVKKPLMAKVSMRHLNELQLGLSGRLKMVLLLGLNRQRSALELQKTLTDAPTR